MNVIERPAMRRFAASACAGLASALLFGCDGLVGANDSAPGEAYAVAGLSDPHEAQIDLGRRLFFDGALSRPAGVSCGACHDPFTGWGDARAQGKGVQDNTLAGDTNGDGVQDHEPALAVAGPRYKTVLTPRNTPTVYNAHLFPRLFWDGRAGDLAHQGVFPIEAGPEMNSSWEDHVLPLLNADPQYVAAFEAAFASPPTREFAGQAIGAYEATVTVFDTPYDAYLAGDTGALSPLELQGHDLFFGAAGCAGCHPGPLLTDFAFHNTGVPSAGVNALMGTVDLGAGRFDDLTQDPPAAVDEPADYAKFKTPQLRMVAITGPYMHNGGLETLEEVVQFYNSGGGPDLSGQGSKDPLIVPLGLTGAEEQALVAFLSVALTGTEIR
jgi:cytochrome c peroxidase